MLDALNNIDTKLFLAINGAHSGFWDTLMWHISGKLQWIPLYMFIAGFLIYRFRVRAIWVILSAILVISLPLAAGLVALAWHAASFSSAQPAGHSRVSRK